MMQQNVKYYMAIKLKSKVESARISCGHRSFFFLVLMMFSLSPLSEGAALAPLLSRWTWPNNSRLEWKKLSKSELKTSTNRNKVFSLKAVLFALAGKALKKLITLLIVIAWLLHGKNSLSLVYAAYSFPIFSLCSCKRIANRKRSPLLFASC